MYKYPNQPHDFHPYHSIFGNSKQYRSINSLRGSFYGSLNAVYFVKHVFWSCCMEFEMTWFTDDFRRVYYFLVFFSIYQISFYGFVYLNLSCRSAQREYRCLMIKMCVVWFPALPWEFSLVGNYLMVWTDWVFQRPLSMFCPVFSSEEVPVLCWTQVRWGTPIVSVILYVEIQNPCHRGNWYKGGIKETKKKNSKLCIRRNFLFTKYNLA